MSSPSADLLHHPCCAGYGSPDAVCCPLKEEACAADLLPSFRVTLKDFDGRSVQKILLQLVGWAVDDNKEINTLCSCC